MEKCEINKNIETAKTSNSVINTYSEEQIQNLRDIQTNNFIIQSTEEINNLKRELQVTEKDRDNAKQSNIVLIAMCIKILELDDITKIKNEVKETIHRCTEIAFQSC